MCNSFTWREGEKLAESRGSSYRSSLPPKVVRARNTFSRFRSRFLDSIKGLFRYETTKAGEMARHQSGLKSCGWNRNPAG